jgi:hypothetical protein
MYMRYVKNLGAGRNTADGCAAGSGTSVTPKGINTMFHRFLMSLCPISLIFALGACGGGSGDGAACDGGELGCVCTPAQTCDEGLACVDQQCQRPDALELLVSDPAARSCELLVQETDTRVVGADFGPAVTGVHLREGSRSAVSFLANDDAAIPSGAISLQVVAPSAGSAAAGIDVVTARCFDREGRELAGATVRTGT